MDASHKVGDGKRNKTAVRIAGNSHGKGFSFNFPAV
jgi:hypothetical protein